MSNVQVSASNASKLEPWFRPDLARTDACGMAPNLTVLKGDILAKNTSTQQYGLRNNSLTNGLQTATHIARQSFVTDANGLVYYGTGVSPVPSIDGDWDYTAMNYKAGDFLRSQLNGITDEDIAEMGGSVWYDGTNAVVHIP
jgi:hypothetical protein